MVLWVLRGPLLFSDHMIRMHMDFQSMVSIDEAPLRKRIQKVDIKSNLQCEKTREENVCKTLQYPQKRTKVNFEHYLGAASARIQNN